MKLQALETLSVIIKMGTMAAAADALSLTPSAVSMQVKQLEAYLGQPLFDRSGLRVKPLALALELAQTAQPILQRVDELHRRTSEAVEGTIRLGIINSMQPTLLPPVVVNLRSQYPKLQMRSVRGKSVELTDAVKAGHLDVAVVGQPELGGSARLDWIDLLRLEFFLIVPPFESETGVTRLIRSYDLIQYDSKNAVSGRVAARYLAKRLPDKKVAMEFDEIRAVFSMVSAGLGVAVVQLSEPRTILSYPVKVIRLEDSPMMQYSIVTRKGESDIRTIRALISVVKTVVQTSIVSPERLFSIKEQAPISRVRNEK